MKRWINHIAPLVLVVVLTSFSFRSSKSVKVPTALQVVVAEPVRYPDPVVQTDSIGLRPPFIGSSFIGFKEDLAFRESSGNYFIINTLGYIGKYQFGIRTLKVMGVYSPKKFLKSPQLQEKVFHTNIARNKWILRKDIHIYTGKRIRGIRITESGILAAAHLAGPGNVRKYLRSWGRWDVKDAYGTSISDYMKKFSGYDVSLVMPQRNPQI